MTIKLSGQRKHCMGKAGAFGQEPHSNKKKGFIREKNWLIVE